MLPFGSDVSTPAQQVGLVGGAGGDERDPEVFLLAKWFFVGLGNQVQKTTHFLENNFVLEYLLFFVLGAPRLQKTLGQQNTSGSL